MARQNSIMVSRAVYQIGWMTLVAAIMWLAIGVYVTLTQPVSVVVDKKMTDPLVTNIDQDLVDQIVKRLKIGQDISIDLSASNPGSESGIQEVVLDDTIEVESSENDELIN